MKRNRMFFRWMNSIALLAMLFASLAPSVSHALAGQGSTSGFLQEICSTGGKKLFIQVVTTQGKTLQAGLNIKPSSQPASISHHLNHCPFCHAGTADVVLPDFNPAFALYLHAQEKSMRFDYVAPVKTHVVQTAHLTRAPPALL